MKNVNITPAAKTLAANAEMFIKNDVQTVVRPNGIEEEIEVVAIGEEDTDFYISYGIGKNGGLYLLTSPSYVEDLPAHVDTSLALKRVLKYAIECCQAA